MSYSKDKPFPASLLKKYSLTKGGSTKSCYHLELSIDPKEISYVAGDSVGILPENSSEIVEKIIGSLNEKQETIIFSTRYNKEFTLFEYLTKKANLTKITNSLFQWLFEKSTNQKSFLPYLENKPELTQHLQSFEMWDLLEELKPNYIPAQEFCNKLLPQMPRFYSIASSPLVHPNEIHLTVAEVSYTTRGHPRQGIASRYLCRNSKLGDSIPLYIQPSHGFTLPLDPQIPILLIGPGTGVAPFRAFLQERAHTKSPHNWLFFGERNRSTDFYYQEFLEELAEKKLLSLSTAFSRDQAHKVYVQHLLLDHAPKVWNWIQKGAHIYVCGDASRMAKDVDLALQEIVHNQGGLSQETAIQYLKDLRLQKRYLLDVY